jgi:hypothetical protein
LLPGALQGRKDAEEVNAQMREAVQQVEGVLAVSSAAMEAWMVKSQK